MTTSRQSQTAMRVVRRHPRLAGAALAVVGTIMATQQLNEARALARFVDGDTVMARVVAVEDVGAVTPDFRLHATWVDANGEERSGVAKAYKRDARTLRPGDGVELRLATQGGGVMQQRLYRSAGLLHVGPLAMTPLVAVGGLVVAAGAFLMLTGNAFLRAPG